jgi:hypothetical protein
MKLLDDYFKLQKQIHDQFGYKEDWVVIPLDDCTECYWYLSGEGSGDYVRFAETIEKLLSDGDYYENEIYTQRHLPKWVYRDDKYGHTMVCVDTRTDGNKFLQIFDNTKELKDLKEKK